MEDFSELEGHPCQAETRTDMSHDGQSGADRLLTMQWHDVRSTLQLILAKKRLHREEETISLTHKATTTVYLT